MMLIKRRYIFTLLLLILFLPAYSQQFTNPLTIKPALSANFGELRSNHFHSGIDYKTEQVVNKPVVAIEDGYISRISVSPSGFGLALYIDHPSGHTSVYAHLNSFSDNIAKYVKEKQYKLESFRVDLYPERTLFPVKKGQQIALSGNTGSSGGPHLHFEIRDTKSQDPLDVLEFLGKGIPDTQNPDIRGVALYPVTGKGLVNGSSAPTRLTVSKNKSGVPQALNSTIKAWGKIGVGVKAYDRMNGQQNIYGVKHVRLYKDEELVFSSILNRFPFDKTRMLNSFIDFEDWDERSSFYMKSFVEPGNTLQLYKNVNNGYLDINEERDYRMRYELEDNNSNVLTYSFIIKGEPTDIPSKQTCTNYFSWNLNNSFLSYDFNLNIPTGQLYDDVCFSYSKISSTIYFSDIHQVNNKAVPLHNKADIWIKLKADYMDKLPQLGIVRIRDNGKPSWVGGSYKNGGLSVSIRELGSRYAVGIDSIAPKIEPQSPANWSTSGRIRVRMTDNLSGINTFRGEINGKFVLFTNDTKSSYYSYILDKERLLPGKQKLSIIATDAAGNSSEYFYEFDY